MPDRMNRLHPGLCDELDHKNPDGIIHTGDCSTIDVLRQLEEIAPVLAVRGNRDWFLEGRLPNRVTLSINGQKISCTHGHGSLFHYFIEKVKYFTVGYQQSFYASSLLQDFPDSGLIIFGHSHVCLSKRYGGQLLFNPGSSVHVPNPKCGRTFGMIEISPEGVIHADICPLTGWKRKGRDWVEES